MKGEGNYRPLKKNWSSSREVVTEEVQEFREIANHFRGVFRIYLEFIVKKPEDVNMPLVGF